MFPHGTPFSFKYAFSFLLISALLVWLAIRHPWWSPWCVWGAFSFGYVSIAYMWIGPRALFKSREGRHPWWLRVLLAPFMFYTLVVWHVWRWLNPENATDRVGPDLILGRRQVGREFDAEVDYYVDLTSEFQDPPRLRQHPGYRCYPILDAMVPPEDKLAKWAAEVKDGTVFIHCAQGHGRTGTFALALLLARGEVRTYDEGLAKLQAVRPKLNLNARQEAFMRAYFADHGGAG